MKYYKAFNRDLTCRGFQYEEGKEYEVPGEPSLCEYGFHFCKDLVLTLGYYPVENEITENKYAEIEVLGDVVFEEPTKHKGVTNKIRIVRVLPDKEVLEMVDDKSNSGDWNSGDGNSGDGNSGDGNSGYGNSGDWNSGDGNSGDWNSGNRNSGYGNSGDWNSGYGNSGYGNSGYGNSGYGNSGNRNSGDWNSGYGNSGYGNSGDWNSGDWNSCDHESGYFNTEPPTHVRVFNRPCLKSEWDEAEKPDFLYFDPGDNYKAAFQKAFEGATEEQVEQLKALPNFDADVFFELSGIRIDPVTS